jgi:hypothetical protein
VKDRGIRGAPDHIECSEDRQMTGSGGFVASAATACSGVEVCGATRARKQ